MRLSNRLGMFIVWFTVLGAPVRLGPPVQAQLKDMPSQAEFDPILENAEKKVKDFLATLTEFRVEAAGLDAERLETDLKDFQELRQMIHTTESDPKAKRNGVNMQRLVGILSGVDDAALEAATWKSLAELRMCTQLVQHQNPGRYDQFGTRAAMNLQMLSEVGGQLFHPTFRAAVAVDEIIDTFADTSSNDKPKLR